MASFSEAMANPESKITVKTQQRGSTFRMHITVSRFSRCHDANTVLTTDPINVDNWALLVIKCNYKNTTEIDVSLRMIKNENIRKCTLQITCGNFSTPICLSEEWAETKILTTKYNTELRRHVSDFIPMLIYMINIEVKITEFEKSMPIFINKKLYEDVESTDFQLHTADGTVEVHKDVLCTHSDMFRTMFRGEWKETAEGRIKLDGVTVQTLQHLKDYMYLGTLPDEGLEPLLVLAARYIMDKLKEDCSAKLVKTIKPENFDDIVEFAGQNKMCDLVRALIMEIPDNVINKVHQLKKITNKNNEVII